MMKRNKWIWMGHAGHFILANHCRFHLNTYVNGHIVSTIGELWNERRVREIHAEVYNPEWSANNKHLPGDEFDNAYMEKFGFEEIGSNRKYETMVFKAKKSKNKCCPYCIIVNKQVDGNSYKTADDAQEGHLILCKKWDGEGGKPN